MDESEFEEQLDQLVSAAVEDGIRLDGGYPVRCSSEDLPNYEVTITKISKTAD